MFVKTQFNRTNSGFPKIINLAQFKKIEVRRYEKKDRGGVSYEIYAFSEKRERREILAKFPEDKKEQAQNAYDDLFNALLAGETAFDMTGYITYEYDHDHDSEVQVIKDG